jgi:hypothetical protein
MIYDKGESYQATRVRSLGLYRVSARSVTARSSFQNISVNVASVGNSVACLMNKILDRTARNFRWNYVLYEVCG